jgi:hypothetical protein
LEVGPNPSAGAIAIDVALTEPAAIVVDVLDTSGRPVATVADGSYDAGRHRLSFDAGGLASGMYICRLRSRSGTATRSFVHMR